MANGLFQPLETYQDYSTRIAGDRNALARQQQQLTQADQQFQWDQQDRAARAAQAEQAKVQAQREWLYNGVRTLASVRNDPVAFARVADSLHGEALARGLPSKREEYTPEALDAVMAQVGIQAGVAPPAPPKRDVRVINGVAVDFTNGQPSVLYTAPTKPEYRAVGNDLVDTSSGQPKVVYRAPGGNEGYRTLTPEEAKAAGLGPGVYQQGPKGKIEAVAGSSTSKPTVEQLKVADYATRMDRAEAGIGTFTPSTSDYVAANTAMERGTVIGAGANSAVSKEAQKFYSAASAWVRAKLRWESGAAIGAQEMAQEIKTFFPVPGDSPEVIAQKAEMRRQAVEGMAAQAGPAAPKLTERAPAGGSGRKEASPEAVAYLRQHPEFKSAFKAKYGYLPDGM